LLISFLRISFWRLKRIKITDPIDDINTNSCDVYINNISVKIYGGERKVERTSPWCLQHAEVG